MKTAVAIQVWVIVEAEDDEIVADRAIAWIKEKTGIEGEFIDCDNANDTETPHC